MSKDSEHKGTLRQLIRHRGYWRWSLAAQMLNLPSFMTAFGFVLVSMYVRGNQSLGGLMITVYVVCSSVFAAPCGRIVDRLGPSRGIPLMSLLRGTVFSALGLVTFEKGPASLLVLFAGLAGVFSSGGGMRKLLQFVVPKSLFRAALALDATLVEVTVAAAPLIVAVAAILSPACTVIVMALSCVVGAITVWTFQGHSMSDVGTTSVAMVQSDAADGNPLTTNNGTLWRNRQFWFWMLVQFAFGHVFGTVETAVLPWAIQIGGGAGTAGMALTILSICSGLGGLLYLRVSRKISWQVNVETIVLLILVETGCLVLALSHWWIIGVCGISLLGFCTAPLNVVISDAAAHCMPLHRQSEGFAALASIYMAGYGMGGLLLAILPLHWMMLSASATGMVVVVLTSTLSVRRLANRPQTLAD
jgi:MFS family permease